MTELRRRTQKSVSIAIHALSDLNRDGKTLFRSFPAISVGFVHRLIHRVNSHGSRGPGRADQVEKP
jgi:hypothetical protein